MTRIRLLACALTFALLLSAVAPAAASAVDTTQQPSLATTHASGAAATTQTNETAPPDPPEDVLGWENGYWYNESISVDRSDGLNDSELDAVVARGMARVEQIRGLEFEETPPVAVISREQYQENLSEQFEEQSTTENRLHQNVKYEALFMIGESTDAVEQQRRNLAGGVLGFYDSENGRIKIISENTETPEMDEITLAQELFHALQDQRFNTSGYNQSTRELHNARDGIIEGDGNYVDYLYQQRCEDDWDCLMPQDQGGLSGFDPHQGLYRISLQPYSSGPAFVQRLERQQGWEAVNDVYANPPASSEQVIHPERYPDDEPVEVHIDDTSQEPWHVLDLNNSLDFAQFGEAGLYVALWYPGLESQRQTEIVPFRSHLNFQADGQSLDPIQPLLYDSSYTDGWGGERLLPYVTDESAETNETGYVYQIEWDSEDDAAEFRDGWEQLMTYHGASPVEGHQNTYRIDEGEFADAFYLVQNGTTVTIVNGPTVEDLPQIHAGAAPAVETDGGGDGTDSDGDTDEMDTPTATAGDDGGADATTDADDGDTGDSGGDDSGDGSGDGTDDSSTATSASGPGFTAGLALVALLAGALLASRRL
jgi:PGF-CTERM protein